MFWVQTRLRAIESGVTIHRPWINPNFLFSCLLPEIGIKLAFHFWWREFWLVEIAVAVIFCVLAEARHKPRRDQDVQPENIAD
jgi:hypothetical protein